MSNEQKPEAPLPKTIGSAARTVTSRLKRAMKFNPDKPPDLKAEDERIADIYAIEDEAEQMAAIRQARREARKNLLSPALRAKKGEGFKPGQKEGRKAKGKRKGNPRERVVLSTMRHKLENVGDRLLDTIFVEGELPMDFLLRQMRSTRNKLPVRIQCAVAVAPYIHPRLAFIQSRKSRDPDDIRKVLEELADVQRTINGQASEERRIPSFPSASSPSPTGQNREEVPLSPTRNEGSAQAQVPSGESASEAPIPETS